MRREWDSCSLLLERADYQWEDLLTSWVCINNPSNALDSFFKRTSYMFMNILNEFDVECYYVSPAYAWVMTERWRKYFTRRIEFQNPFKFMHFTTCIPGSRQSVCCASNGNLVVCCSLPHVRCDVSPAEEEAAAPTPSLFAFVTGSNGPQKFCIEKVGKENWLPRSHTWWVCNKSEYCCCSGSAGNNLLGDFSVVYLNGWDCVKANTKLHKWRLLLNSWTSEKLSWHEYIPL